MKISWKEEGHKIKIFRDTGSWDMEVLKDGKMVYFNISFADKKTDAGKAMKIATEKLRRALC